MRFPFTIDLGRAFFAVALAVLLYFVALSETNLAGEYKTNFAVPLQVVNQPPALVVITPVQSVAVWVTSTQSVFNRLRPESFTAQVDATGAVAGDNDLTIAVSTTDPEQQRVRPEQ